MTDDALVSIVIPTKNSEKTIEVCLKSIEAQTYPRIEILVVDSYSTDGTPKIAKKLNAKVTESETRRSEARNVGIMMSTGKYVLFLDSDMELTQKVVEECVERVKNGCDAIIIPEVSVGTGFWAACKAVEKSCYIGDDSIEAPRFMRREVFEAVKGYDPELEAGEDWDLGQRIKETGRRIGRISALIKHHEGSMSLWKTIQRKYKYGKTLGQYRKKHPNEANRQFRLVRQSLVKNWRKSAANPIHVFGMFFMKACEFGAGWLGHLEARVVNDKS